MCAHPAYHTYAHAHDKQVAIARAGGIEPLVALVRDGTAAQKEYAAGALGNLSLNEDNQVAMSGLAAVKALLPFHTLLS